MHLRFSIKWLLGAMAYCAMAAAALTQPEWPFGAVLWLATFTAFAYALMAACYFRGIRQAAALGFCAIGALHTACLYFAPNTVPIKQFATALRPKVAVSPPVLPGQLTQVPRPTAANLAMLRSNAISDAAMHRALNALATMLAGLIGAISGAVVYRQACQNSV